MLPLLFLAGLAAAEAGEPPVPANLDVDPAFRQVGDLEIEGTLARLGLSTAETTQVHAEWLPAMPAPKRSRAEGRELGWEFDVDRVWVTQRRLADGRVLSKTEAAGTWRHPDPCAQLAESSDHPMTLRAVAPPIRRTSDPLGENERRHTVTVAHTDEERLLLIGLKPGESATLVEMLPNAETRPRKRARLRRQLSVQAVGAEIELQEHEAGQAVCVRMEPTPEVIVLPETPISLEWEVRKIQERLKAEEDQGSSTADETAEDGVVQSED